MPANLNGNNLKASRKTLSKSKPPRWLLSLTNNFWLLLIVAIFCQHTPYLSVPFNWLESYFHELSHGIGAILSGGSIVQIQLFSNGAGLCTTQGGWRIVIAFSGYFGAVLWGLLIYKIADTKGHYSRYLSMFLVVIILLSTLLYAADLLTFIIAMSLALLFASTIKLSNNYFMPVLLKLFALIVLLNSVNSPLYLLNKANLSSLGGANVAGDSANLAQATFIPEFIWITVWCAFGAWALLHISGVSISFFKRTKSRD